MAMGLTFGLNMDDKDVWKIFQYTMEPAAATKCPNAKVYCPFPSE